MLKIFGKSCFSQISVEESDSKQTVKKINKLNTHFGDLCVGKVEEQCQVLAQVIV